MDADKQAARSDPPDLVRFLFGTDASFGEALAVRWRDRAGSDTATTLAKLAPIYLAQIKRRKSGTTYDRYKTQLDKHIVPSLGQLLIRECTVGRSSGT